MTTVSDVKGNEGASVVENGHDDDRGIMLGPTRPEEPQHSNVQQDSQLCLPLFLSALETTIVSTSLISITIALGDFEQRDWVVTAYLITYTGFLVVYAKFSDILGQLYSDLYKAWAPPESTQCAPAGAVATGLIAFAMPTHFPNLDSLTIRMSFRGKILRASLSRLDIIGAALLLSSSALIVFAFEEAGSRFSWQSPSILSTLIIGGALFVAFIIWEKFAGSPRSPWEPVFPLRLMKDRLFSRLIVVAFCTGPPFMTVLINLPQRFQAVDGESPFKAVIRLLPLLLASPVATAVSGQLVGRFKIPPFYLLLFGASLQLLGIGLASSTRFTSGNAMYGYEILMGFGFGMGLVSLLIFTPMVVKRADMAVSMGAITQIRVLGGTIGLAISSTVLNNHLSANLPGLLSPWDIMQISDSVQYVNTLPDDTREAVRQVFADGFNAQMRVMMYFNVAVWIFALTLWERRLRSAATVEGY
ncbi:hypothetical protein AAE478_001444 [Parahypoxylon ruwenzoriense]